MEIILVGNENCYDFANTNGEGVHFVRREIYKDEGLGNTRVTNKPLFELTWEQLRRIMFHDPELRKHL